MTVGKAIMLNSTGGGTSPVLEMTLSVATDILSLTPDVVGIGSLANTAVVMTVDTFTATGNTVRIANWFYKSDGSSIATYGIRSRNGALSGFVIASGYTVPAGVTLKYYQFVINE